MCKESSSIKMNHKESFIPLIVEHQNIFGEGTIGTAATDKGYWSEKNKKFLIDLAVNTAGLQKPANLKQTTTDLDLQEALHNRRAGIGPMIGHAKQGEGGPLKKSRMKGFCYASSSARVRLRLELASNDSTPTRKDKLSSLGQREKLDRDNLRKIHSSLRLLRIVAGAFL
jgi:hypothetical protein